MKGGVDGLMPDSAPPTAGKLRRTSDARCLAGLAKINGFGGFLLHLFNHRLHRFTRISSHKDSKTRRCLVGFGVLS